MRINYGFVQVLDPTNFSVANKLEGSDCCQVVSDFWNGKYQYKILIPTAFLGEKKEEDLIKWLEFIEKMNFRFVYLGLTTNSYHNTDNAGVNNEYYELRLEGEEYKSPAHCLAAYQALRVIHQNYFTGVVEECYRLKEIMPELDEFRCLQLAYRVSPYYNGTFGFQYYGGRDMKINQIFCAITDENNHKNSEIGFQYKPVSLTFFESQIKNYSINKSCNRSHKSNWSANMLSIIENKELEELIEKRDVEGIVKLETDDKELEYFK